MSPPAPTPGGSRLPSIRACCQIDSSFRRKPESSCFGGATTLLQQTIPAPAPAGMTKMRLLNIGQSNLTTPSGACVHFTRHPVTLNPSFRRKPESSACAAIAAPISCQSCPRNRRRNGTKRLRHSSHRDLSTPSSLPLPPSYPNPTSPTFRHPGAAFPIRWFDIL